MLNLAPPESLSLFIMISVIVSIALLPIALIPRTAPKIEDPQPIEFKALFEASPTGILTVFSGGFIGATMLTIGPLYFLESGIKIQSIGLMISAYILGGLLGQIPMGILSDLMPRRRLLLGMLCISSISALIFYVLHSQSNDILILYIALTCLGITGNTMHAVAVAYTNDSLEPEQYVTASSALIMINGLGTLTGPILISSCLALIGNDILFLLLSGMFALIFVIALMRSFISKATPMEDQADYISLPSSTTMISAQIADED
jgi:MFS family permease